MKKNTTKSTKICAGDQQVRGGGPGVLYPGVRRYTGSQLQITPWSTGCYAISSKTENCDKIYIIFFYFFKEAANFFFFLMAVPLWPHSVPL